MARHKFGGLISDWAVTRESSTGVLSAIGGETLTFWTLPDGGEQYTDLIDELDQPTDHIIVATGSGVFAAGVIPQFYGPDNIWSMWASMNGGARQLVLSSELATNLGPLADSLDSAFSAHVAARNPHGVTSVDLVDVSDIAPTANGQIPVWDLALGLYVPTTVTGLSPSAYIHAAGGSDITIAEADNLTRRALQMFLPSGDRVAAGALDAFTVWWNAGTGGSPTWRSTFSLDPFGQLRLRPSAADRVAAQIRAFSDIQTANLLEFLDTLGNVKCWIDIDGRVRAPNLGITPTWTADTAAVATGTYRIYNTTGKPLTLRGFSVNAGGNAPTGTSLIINPRLDGAAIYTSGNRPTIAIGQRYSGLATAMSITTWPSGSYLTVDIDQVGSTSAGTKITIQALAY